MPPLPGPPPLPTMELIEQSTRPLSTEHPSPISSARTPLIHTQWESEEALPTASRQPEPSSATRLDYGLPKQKGSLRAYEALNDSSRRLVKLSMPRGRGTRRHTDRALPPGLASPRISDDASGFDGAVHAPRPPPRRGEGFVSAANQLVGRVPEHSAHSWLRNIVPIDRGWNVERGIRACALFYRANRYWLRPILVLGCAAGCVGIAALALAVLV